MYELSPKEEHEKVALKLPLFYGDEPAFSVNLSDVHSLTGLLVRTHATLCLLYYTNDPKLTDIRDTVKSAGFLTDDVIKSVASLYPLDFVSLTAGSPFELELLSPKAFAEATEIILRLPGMLSEDSLDRKKKKYEFEQQQKEDEKKNTPLQLSSEEMERIFGGAAPKELIDLAMRGDTDKIIDAYKVLIISEQHKQETAKTAHYKALAVYHSALAINEMYKMPGFEKAPSIISQTELEVYNTELMRNNIIHQLSDLHFYPTIQNQKKGENNYNFAPEKK